jgi:putative oxidoreductase
MRLVAGIAIGVHGVTTLRGELPIAQAILQVLAVGAGLLLFAGLWTPIAGTLVAIIALWNTFSQPGDPWLYVVLATLGVGLALLGPGAWSLDARLFGWKRIDIRDRDN